jgi:hypothetical protein
MMHERDAYVQVQRRALQAFETPPQSIVFPRLSDLVLMTRPSYDNWDALHVWFEAEPQRTLATRVFWRRLFDSQRFSDPAMGARYGREETPTMRITHHSPPYEELQQYLSAVLGAVPVRSLEEDEWHGLGTYLILRLPLHEISWWVDRATERLMLLHECRTLHDWVLTTPVLKS